jgi:hypothetical protein
MTEAALMVGMELMDSGDPDDEVIGIMLINRVLAGDDDEDDEEMALLLAAAASHTARPLDPYLVYVRDGCRCPPLAGTRTC